MLSLLLFCLKFERRFEIVKFIVDELPYYEEICPFWTMCPHNADDVCPRHWDKYKVTSDENPHECHFLIEQEF